MSSSSAENQKGLQENQVLCLKRRQIDMCLIVFLYVRVAKVCMPSRQQVLVKLLHTQKYEMKSEQSSFLCGKSRF